jgi:hypothetical protein
MVEGLHPARLQIHFDPVLQFGQRFALEIIICQERDLPRRLVKESEMTNGVFCHFMARIAPRWRLSASGPSPTHRRLPA